MNRFQPWLKPLGFVAFLWIAVGILMAATEDQVSDPEEVLGLMEDAPWFRSPGLNADLRGAHLEEVLVALGQLNSRQRADLREDGDEIETRFFDSLTEEEQEIYVDATLNRAFEFVMRALDAMGEEERQSFLARLRRDLQRRGVRLPEAEEGEAGSFEEMLSFGLEMRFQDASAAEKRDLAPLLEDMQNRLRGFRR